LPGEKGKKGGKKWLLFIPEEKGREEGGCLGKRALVCPREEGRGGKIVLVYHDQKGRDKGLHKGGGYLTSGGKG